MFTSKKLSPQSVVFPKQARDWIDYCYKIVKEVSTEHQELINGYGVDWYKTGKRWKIQSKPKPRRVLFLSPHADDLELTGAAAIRCHVQSGNEVSELLFTCGSAGRSNRGFPDSKTFGTVRLAEAIMAAREVGIHKVGVIILPDGSRGFQELFWDGDDINLRPVWISLVRQLNPHYIFSPHPDPEIDKHPDHHATAMVAEWMVDWGTEADFYQAQIPGKTDAFQEWWRYAIWSGEKTLPITDSVEFDPKGEIAQMKKKALEYFASQNGKSYGQIAAGYNIYHGGMVNIDSDKILSAEVFSVYRPVKVIMAQWRE